jgi:hypothetical protein
MAFNFDFDSAAGIGIAMEEDKEADDGDDNLPPLVHRVGYSIGDNVVRQVLSVPCMPCGLNAIANNEDSADEGKEMDQEDDILPSFINLNLNFNDEGTDKDEGIDPLELSHVTTEATSTTPLSRKSIVKEVKECEQEDGCTCHSSGIGTCSYGSAPLH